MIDSEQFFLEHETCKLLVAFTFVPSLISCLLECLVSYLIAYCSANNGFQNSFQYFVSFNFLDLMLVTVHIFEVSTLKTLILILQLDEAASILASLKEPIVIAKVDADKFSSLASKYDIEYASWAFISTPIDVNHTCLFV
jgi:hypothetical protein